MPIQKNVARPNVAFQSLTAAGAANTATTPTVVVSKDGGAQAAASNAPTHLGNGHWRIDLTAAEMNADVVVVVAYGSGLVPSQVAIYPESSYTSTRATAIDNLDAAVSTRLATAGYTVPPTAAAVRTEMDANSTKLANLDAAVSTRLATAGYTVPPTAAAVGAAVWADTTGAANTAKIVALDAAVTASQTTGAVADGTGTTTAFTVSGLSQTKSYVGMMVEFTSGGNAATRQQITAQTNSAANVRLTVGAAFGAAPASGDTVSVF